jgi:hypothetical protein
MKHEAACASPFKSVKEHCPEPVRIKPKLTSLPSTLLVYICQTLCIVFLYKLTVHICFPSPFVPSSYTQTRQYDRSNCDVWDHDPNRQEKIPLPRELHSNTLYFLLEILPQPVSQMFTRAYFRQNVELQNYRSSENFLVF